MSRYHYRLLNVFAETTLGGNPLCVFEDGRGLTDQQMQALARQFNLSETTFILPSEQADARVRVFTTGHEMRFAGHPALGSAHAVRALQSPDLPDGTPLQLEFLAGVVAVTPQSDVWQFCAPSTAYPPTRPLEISRERLAALLGLTVDDLGREPMWVDTDSDQMLVPLNSLDAVRRAAPAAACFEHWPVSSLGRKTVYVFAFDTPRDPADDGVRQVLARFFFVSPAGGVSEDPGTGSACANLGGWLLTTGHALPVSCQVAQGAAVERPCHLQLEVNVARQIRVGGRVIELGRGYIDL